MKKRTYLFLALLLPGLIFVFLKYAGSNRFDIPVYYEDGLTDSPRDCPSPGTGPYRLPDSVWQHMGNVRRMANVIIFPTGSLSESAISEAIREEIGTTSITFSTDSTFGTDSLTRQRWKACTFLVEGPSQTVLFDSTGRIRGYYDLRLREEIDRLRVELKILVQQY